MGRDFQPEIGDLKQRIFGEANKAIPTTVADIKEGWLACWNQLRREAIPQRRGLQREHRYALEAVYYLGVVSRLLDERE